MRVLTCNVNGLRRKLTRFTIFREIKRLKVDICLLQETFINNEVADDLKKSWKGKLFYHAGTSNSLGDIILISDTFNYDEIELVHHEEKIL